MAKPGVIVINLFVVVVVVVVVVVRQDFISLKGKRSLTVLLGVVFQP